MNIEQLAAWGEFLGGIAVVAGLIFVGLQLRAANRESRLAANRAYAESIVSIGTLLNSNDSVAEIFYRGMQNLNDLTPVEQVRFQSLISNNILRTFENLHEHNKTGNLEDYIWNGAVTMLRSTLVYPGVVEVWKSRRAFYNPSFQDFVDELISNKIDAEIVALYKTEAQNGNGT